MRADLQTALAGAEDSGGGAETRPWRTHHWVVQGNRLHDNRWGIWGRWGDWVHLANNTCENNAEGNSLEEVTNLTREKGDPSVRLAPLLGVSAPQRAVVGLGIALDSWGGDPFVGWLDGMTFE